MCTVTPTYLTVSCGGARGTAAFSPHGSPKDCKSCCDSVDHCPLLYMPTLSLDRLSHLLPHAAACHVPDAQLLSRQDRVAIA